MSPTVLVEDKMFLILTRSEVTRRRVRPSSTVKVCRRSEKLMVATMAKNDPSHDKYHGKSRSFSGGRSKFNKLQGLRPGS